MIDREGNLKILDFGLATEESVQSSKVLGTLDYLAPSATAATGTAQGVPGVFGRILNEN